MPFFKKNSHFLFTISALLSVGFMVFSFHSPSKHRISAEIEQELENIPLQIEGKVPDWLAGTLVRNGPIKVTIDGKSNSHWFDGLAMLHAFSFDLGKVCYTNRFLRSNDYQTVFEKGSLHYDGFASDPCRSLFKRFFTFFFPPTELPIQNANVNVAKLQDRYIALTEVPLPVEFDIKTLKTLGVFDYQDALPKAKCWESAHPHFDAQKKRTLNYLIQFGKTSFYTLYQIEEGTSSRNILSKIPVERPSYMHSFSITENYVIFTEYPFSLNPLDLLVKNEPFIKNFSWHPDLGTRFTVIERASGKKIGSYSAKPFFAFHHAGAFEEQGKIHLDIVTYANADILTGDALYLDSQAKDAPSSCLERFTLSLESGEISSKPLLSQTCEFPRIKDSLDGLPYRYIYLTGFADEVSSQEETAQAECLYKVDTETNTILKWSEKGCSPGEPVFVASPDSRQEDDGVLLALVLDSSLKRSFLLILNAKTFEEIARAFAPHLIPQGFHGQYFE
jgi:carotenoid cleavage dioxygenase-like enzyme